MGLVADPVLYLEAMHQLEMFGVVGNQRGLFVFCVPGQKHIPITNRITRIFQHRTNFCRFYRCTSVEISHSKNIEERVKRANVGLANFGFDKFCVDFVDGNAGYESVFSSDAVKVLFNLVAFPFVVREVHQHIRVQHIFHCCSIALVSLPVSGLARVCSFLTHGDSEARCIFSVSAKRFLMGVCLRAAGARAVAMVMVSLQMFNAI